MISIVIIEPETPGNIGSIARVMSNFDMKELVLINPKCEIDSESRRFAKNAQAVLEGAKIRDMKVLKEFDYLIATTSKIGTDYNIPKTPMTPEQLADKLSEIKGKKVALVLGRESDGLHNDEIALCDFIVTIPASKKHDSFNISHALAIFLYEIRKKSYSRDMLKPYTPISAAEKEQIMKMLDSAMKSMDFRDDGKMQTQRSVWKRMISKSFMTRREAYALMGFLKKVSEKKK
jgi:TrmH family RNA methyltransferase